MSKQGEKPNFRSIGKGFCGSVWVADDTSRTNIQNAIKREDGSSYRSLINDYNMHKRVVVSFEQTSTLFGQQVQVPKPFSLIQQDDSWWDSRESRFPEGYTRCRVLVSERIPPMAKQARDAIIDRYCPEQHREEIRTSQLNGDCLIRPYLGKRCQHRDENKRFFALRNYPLCADQMEDMGLDTGIYVKFMADTLAILFWKAHIEASDVEFVIAPVRKDHPSAPVIASKELGDHTIWLLDFDCCQDMSMDEAGIQRAVKAFYRNDRYYPRPHGEGNDQTLWQIFKKQFLDSSYKLLEPDDTLPARLIDELERVGSALKTGQMSADDLLFSMAR